MASSIVRARSFETPSNASGGTHRPNVPTCSPLGSSTDFRSNQTALSAGGCMLALASSTFEPDDFVMNANEAICVESIDGPVECLALVSCIHYQNGSNSFEPVIDEA